jgi:hypothetical protein
MTQMDRDQIIAIISDSQLFTDNWTIQCCHFILAFKWLLIQHSTISNGNVFQRILSQFTSIVPAAEFDLVRSDGQDHTMLFFLNILM